MRQLLSVFAAAFFVGLLSTQAQAACGVFEVTKGDVKTVTGKTKKTAPASVGQKICSGDTVIAGKASRAKIKMEDGNELNISPESQIILEQYEFNPRQNKKKVLLNVLKGKVRASTSQSNMYNDKAADGTQNAFEVKTKSAVAGVRGTDFLTSYDARSNATEVITFRGQVEVGQLGPDGKIINVVQVEAGQRSIIVPGQPPAPPQPVSDAELNKVSTETNADAADVKEPKPAPAAPGTESSDGRSSDGASNAPASGTSPASAEGSASPQGQPKAENRGPASAPPPPAPSMVNTGELTGGEVFRGPNGVPQELAGPPIVAPPPVVVPPTVPECHQCTDAMQKPIKVNVSIKIPGQ